MALLELVICAKAELDKGKHGGHPPLRPLEHYTRVTLALRPGESGVASYDIEP